MLVLQLQGHVEEAKKISDELEEAGPEGVPVTLKKGTMEEFKSAKNNVWMRHKYNQAHFDAINYDFQPCYQKLEYGRFLGVYGHENPYRGAPLFNPKKGEVKDKTVLIIMEGGLGDEIINIRFLKKIKEFGVKTIVACHPTLNTIFSNVDGIDTIINKFDLEKINSLKVDFWLPSFSLGWVCDYTYDTLPNEPYLSISQDSILSASNAFDKTKKNIGIRWAGNPGFDHSSYRKFPVEFLLNLSKYDNVQLYSFQRDEDTVQLPKEVKDLQNVIINWEITASYLMNLDLLITSCTSLAHMAAALGVETWVVVPILPYTLWAPGAPNSTDSPWYKSVKLYRQKKFKLWNEIFQKLYRDFEEKFTLESIDQPNEDREILNLNLGCGFKKYVGYLNVDKIDLVQPDIKVDLNVFPWPWEDNSVDNIILENILQYIDLREDNFIKVIRELYRISKNGSSWYVTIPDNQNLQKKDPDYLNEINYNTFYMFDKIGLFKLIEEENLIFKEMFLEEIDISIEKFKKNPSEFMSVYSKRNGVEGEQKFLMENNFLNTIDNMTLQIRVHKPMRMSNKKIIQHYEREYDEPFIL
jgi:hypothetical protein